MRARALLALLLAQPRTASALLDVYSGREPADARSTRFSVALHEPQQDVVGPQRLSLHGARPVAAVVLPMVYMTSSPDEDLDNIHKGPAGNGIFCTLHGAQFCNRTVSWVDFGSSSSSAVSVVELVVTSLHGAVFKNGFTLRPPSPHMLQLRVLDGGHAAQILLQSGARLKFAVEYGAAPLGSFRDALMVFVGDPDPALSDPSSVLAFSTGVTRVPGDGILQLPAGITTVFLPRGAWLDRREKQIGGSGGSCT